MNSRNTYQDPYIDGIYQEFVDGKRNPDWIVSLFDRVYCLEAALVQIRDLRYHDVQQAATAAGVSEHEYLQQLAEEALADE